MGWEAQEDIQRGVVHWVCRVVRVSYRHWVAVSGTARLASADIDDAVEWLELQGLATGVSWWRQHAAQCRDRQRSMAFLRAASLRLCFEEWRWYDEERHWLDSFATALETVHKAAAVADWRNYATEARWLSMVQRMQGRKGLSASLRWWWKASCLRKCFRQVRASGRRRVVSGAVAVWSDNFTSVAYS